MWVESDWKNKIESNQIKTTIESNQIENRELNQVENGYQQNCWCRWWGSQRQIRYAMGRLVIRQCACGAHYSNGDANDHKRSRRRIMSMKREGFHVTGLYSGSLGVLLVPSDWRVEVFGSYGLLYRPYDCLHVRAILLYGCMDRFSHYNMKTFITWSSVSCH